MSEIRMMIPYQLNGRDAFHIKFEQFNLYDIQEWEVSSSLPQEIILSSYPQLGRKRKISCDGFTIRSARLLLKNISKAVFHNPISRYFSYAPYLLDTHQQVSDWKAEELIRHLAGFELDANITASKFHNQTLLWSTQKLLFSGYFFYPKEFQSFISQVSKTDFLRSYPVRIPEQDVTLLSFWKYDNGTTCIYYSTRNKIHLEHLVVIRGQS